MKTKHISKRVTKLLEEKDIYPNGANSPTHVKVYKCFCKKGTIIEERVVGFNDHYAYFECETCDEKYAYIDFVGNDWVVDEY